jgi:hypothetical protein
LQNGKISYVNEEINSSIQESRELVKENYPTSISLLKEEKRQELMLIIYLRSRKKHLKKICMNL